MFDVCVVFRRDAPGWDGVGQLTVPRSHERKVSEVLTVWNQTWRIQIVRASFRR